MLPVAPCLISFPARPSLAGSSLCALLRSSNAIAEKLGVSTTGRARGTQIYLEATLAMKERALEKTEPLMSKFTRYRPGDQFLGFLNRL